VKSVCKAEFDDENGARTLGFSVVGPKSGSITDSHHECQHNLLLREQRLHCTRADILDMRPENFLFVCSASSDQITSMSLFVSQTLDSSTPSLCASSSCNICRQIKYFVSLEKIQVKGVSRSERVQPCGIW
jgi:hypothetical protein